MGARLPMPARTQMDRYLEAERARMRDEWYRNAMSDACPSCHAVTAPLAWRLERGQVLATYRCENGHRWPCGWAKSYVESAGI